jgi:hypothetical protein
MLTLDRRDCKIGTAINTRRELHGEEPVPAMDIPIAEIHLSREELQALFDDKTVWDSWFDLRKGDKLPEPAGWVKECKAFARGDKFKDSQAILYVGLKPEVITLVNVKLSKLKLKPLVGGLTALSLTIQCTPEMEKAAKVFDHLDHTAYIALEIGERDDSKAVKNQPELPMDMTKDDKPTKRKSSSHSAAH